MLMSIAEQKKTVKLDAASVFEKIAQNIPFNLQSYPYFCLWGRRNPDGSLALDKKGKIDKTPYNPKTGECAEPNNPATFAPLRDTLQAGRDSTHAGVGVGLFPIVNSPLLLGAIDIDHCINAAGELSDLAQDILQTMAGTYAETSPSGTGCRILFTVKADFYHGDVGGYSRTYRIMGETQPDGQKLEIYIAGFTNKYLTVTGNTMTPGAAVAECGGQILEVLDRYMRRPAAASTSTVPIQTPAGIPDDDAELLRRAMAARNGSKFAPLWNGDKSGYGGDDSAADQALCNLLAFWTGRDAGRMDRLFRQSGLMRPKWDVVHDGTRTYGQMTIDRAIADARDVYNPGGQAAETMTWKPADFTDYGNAAVYQIQYSDMACYVDALGWLTWDGHCWNRDKHGAFQLAIAQALQMTTEAKTLCEMAAVAVVKAKASKDTETAAKAELELQKAQEYRKHAIRSQNRRVVEATMKTAGDSMTVKADALDRGKTDLNTPAGIVDLRTGEIRDPDPFAYCTHITTVAPGSTGAGLWNAFLDDITCKDVELKAYLQTVAGMALYPEIYHEGIVILSGGGSNGKSTFVDCLSGVLGTGETGYAGSLPAAVITGKYRGNELVQYENIRGKRLVSVSELEMKDRLSISVLKTLANRKSTFRIERKFQDPEDVKPTHTILLDTNNLPRVDATDEGTWRRITVVPFNAHFSETDGTVKTNLSDTLLHDAGPAILQWMIDGAIQFGRQNYQFRTLPAAVTAATGQYQHNEDSVSIFVEERCIKDPKKRVGAQELYDSYAHWMQERGEKRVLYIGHFKEQLEKLGYRQTTPAGVKYWVGLSLIAETYQYTDEDAPGRHRGGDVELL